MYPIIPGDYHGDEHLSEPIDYDYYDEQDYDYYELNLSIFSQLVADSTRCLQPLVADSTTYLVLTAPTPGAHSTPNNIINNINEYTSVKTCEVETSPPAISPNNKSSRNDVLEVFTYWQKVMNHPRAKLDYKRQRKIAQAIKLEYSVADLKQAIDGCKNTPFNTGQNDSNQIYDDITLILRDAEHEE